jgi:hypothetical protein
MSNHYHAVIDDRARDYPHFIERRRKPMARGTR